MEDDYSMNGFKEHHPLCVKCKSVCDYIYIPTVPQVAFKDGPSGSWPSKGNRFKKHREQSSMLASKRQRDRYGLEGSTKLVPNFNGKTTENWAEAKSLAKSEKGEDSARTYDKLVKKEKFTSG